MCSAKPQETERCQTLALNYFCKLAGCTLNVQPANLHNIFFCNSKLVMDRQLSVTLFIDTIVFILTIVAAAIWLSIPHNVCGQLSHGTEVRIHLTVFVLYLANSIVNPIETGLFLVLWDREGGLLTLNSENIKAMTTKL